MKKKLKLSARLIDVLIVLMFFIGLSVLLYPTISNYINEKNASKAIALYSMTMDSATDEMIAEMFAQASQYNRNLAEESGAFYRPDLLSGYDRLLDVTGTGIMGYIDIGKIGVQLPLYHGVDATVLQVGVGHLEGTSLPVGGKSTHAVLSGHRGLPSAKLFTDLDKMEIGDTFAINVLRQTLVYQVDQIKVVLPSESEDLRIVPGKDYCTLLTCTPYGINTHRLLVRGVRVHQEESGPGLYIANEAFRIEPIVVAPVLAAPMLIAALILLLIYRHRKRTFSKSKKEETKQA